jgi:hypothetical protein
MSKNTHTDLSVPKLSINNLGAHIKFFIKRGMTPKQYKENMLKSLEKSFREIDIKHFISENPALGSRRQRLPISSGKDKDKGKDKDEDISISTMTKMFPSSINLVDKLKEKKEAKKKFKNRSDAELFVAKNPILGKRKSNDLKKLK